MIWDAKGPIQQLRKWLAGDSPEEHGGGNTMNGLMKKIVGLGVGGVAAALSYFLMSGVVEMVDAEQILVVQDLIDGELHWHTTSGLKPQWFGKVTKYPKRSIYEFTHRGNDDRRIKVRFNDGGHADMDGSIQYEFPLDAESLTKIHVRFGTPEAVQKQLIETVVNKSVYMTGPVMSSKESYAERRNALIHFVEDQVENGVYKTVQRDIKVKDSITGAEKSATIVEVVLGTEGTPERQEPGQMTSLGIRPINFSVRSLDYDNAVEKQIQQQQQLTMDVQTAVAEAKKAEQRAITVAEEGKANAAKAKWEQETIKARAVTEAQQKLEVATLDAKAAEQFKRGEILRGEGESARKRLVMQADGALEPKLDALVKINATYADAIARYQGQWVPSVVMGSGGSAAPASGAQQLVDMLTLKTARDLGLDLNVSGAGRTRSGR